MRRADAAAVSRLASAALAEESRRTGTDATLRRVLGWQAGAWIVVEVEFVQDGAWGTTVLFAIGDEIRHRVDDARVVDWLAVDADETPDVLLWTTGTIATATYWSTANSGCRDSVWLSAASHGRDLGVSQSARLSRLKGVVYSWISP